MTPVTVHVFVSEMFVFGAGKYGMPGKDIHNSYKYLLLNTFETTLAVAIEMI